MKNVAQSIELGGFDGYPSGWNGSNGTIVMHQLDKFGSVAKNTLYAVEDRAPRVYPWVNERDGGILYA